MDFNEIWVNIIFLINLPASTTMHHSLRVTVLPISKNSFSFRKFDGLRIVQPCYKQSSGNTMSSKCSAYDHHDEVPTVYLVIQSVPSEGNAEPVYRAMEITRKVPFTKRLQPFENPASTPRPRRNYNIFGYSCRTIWNKTIQDVQSELTQRLKRQQLDEEAPILREALSDKRIDSDLQQAAINVTEVSNLGANIEADGKATNEQDPIRASDNVATMMQSNDCEEQLEPIDGKLEEVPDCLQPCAEATVTSELQELAKSTVAPVVTTPESPKQKNHKSLHVLDETGPTPELAITSEPSEDSQEIGPLDAMIILILIVVQNELCNKERIENWISVQRLQEKLHITTPLGVSKLFKNLILMKQADLLAVKLNVEHHITDVSVKLPQVDGRN